MKRAQIEYRGTRGVTQACVDALANFLLETRDTGVAVLLSGPADKYGCRSHAFLLELENQPAVLIFDGFSSGYGGAGPVGLSTAIALLHSRQWDINEIQVEESTFERLCDGEATHEEVESLLNKPRRPISLVFDYLEKRYFDLEDMSVVWEQAPICIPLPLIDRRLFDIALRFWSDPDAALNKGYRRLEDFVRDRSGLNGPNDHGTKLFSRAFGNEKSPLIWKVHNEDSICYAQLFTGAFAGFRNNRAHREPNQYESEKSVVTEFLMLNTLFGLAEQLVTRTVCDDQGKEAGAN